MSCNGNRNCQCNKIKSFGNDDVTRIRFDGRDRTKLNWTEISVPEVLPIPPQKPDIENINQVYADAVVDCIKLIETPYAIKIYDRLASTYEISLIQPILDLITAIDLTAIINAVNAILAIPGLPLIPEVAALQAALTGVTEALDYVLEVVADVVAVITGPCVIASVVVGVLRLLIEALNLLVLALNALIAAANALVLATSGIPIVGPLVAAAVAVLVAAINVVIGIVNGIITQLEGVITLFGTTQYFTIAENAEGTCLSGRKIIVEGTLKQKVVYTALVSNQSVHSACFEVPFSAFIIAYARFQDLDIVEDITVVVDPETCETDVISGFPYDPENPPVVDLCEEFKVDVFIEDIFACELDNRNVFKNTTLFLKATPAVSCR